MLLRKSNKGNHTIFLFVCFNYLLCQILNGIFSKLIVSPPHLSSYNIILLTKSMLWAWRQPSLDLCSIQPSGWSPAPSSSPANWGYYFWPCRGYIPRCIALLRNNIVPKQINLLVRRITILRLWQKQLKTIFLHKPYLHFSMATGLTGVLCVKTATSLAAQIKILYLYDYD